MKRRKFAAPFYVDISITNRCNLKCLYCYAEANDNMNIHMSVKLFSKIIKELEDQGVHYVRIAGGEPFIHPQVEDILEVCGKAHMLKSISTNATLLNYSLVKTIINNKINWVVVSLDGADETTNNYTRGKFSDVIRGINLLRANGVMTKIACVITAANYKYIDKIVDFAARNEVYSVGFILQSDVGRAHKCATNINMSSSQLRNFIENVTLIRQKEKKVKVNVVFPYESSMPWELKAFLSEEIINKFWKEYYFGSNNEISCMAGISTCAISASGDLYGCEQMLGFPELAVGNLEDETFDLLWSNFKNIEILREAQSEMLPLKCQNCNIGYCGGGCRAIAYENTRNLMGEDCRCDIVRRDYE